MGSPDPVASDESRPESEDAQAEAALGAWDSPESAPGDAQAEAALGAGDSPESAPGDAEAEAALGAGDSPETASVDEEPPESLESDAEMPSNGDERPVNGRRRNGKGRKRPANGHKNGGRGRRRPANGRKGPANGRKSNGKGRKRRASGRKGAASGGNGNGNGRHKPANGRKAAEKAERAAARKARRQRRRPRVGIEIDGRTVRIAEVRGDEVVWFGTFGPDIGVEEVLGQWQSARKRVRSSSLTVTWAGPRSYLRRLDVPQLPQKAIGQYIATHIAEQLPLRAGTYVLAGAAGGEAGAMSVTAIETAVLSDLWKPLAERSLDLEPAEYVVGSDGLFLSVRNSNAVLILREGGVPVAVRDLGCGGIDRLVEQLSWGNQDGAARLDALLNPEVPPEPDAPGSDTEPEPEPPSPPPGAFEPPDDDPFAPPPGEDPFAPPPEALEPLDSDPFGSSADEEPLGPPPADDPFAPPPDSGISGQTPSEAVDPPGDDPFGSPTAEDTFGPPPDSDAFASPGAGDPFAPPGGDDPFAPPAGGDPFAPPAGDDPFAPPPGDDPFAPPPGAGPFSDPSSGGAPSGGFDLTSDVQAVTVANDYLTSLITETRTTVGFWQSQGLTVPSEVEAYGFGAVLPGLYGRFESVGVRCSPAVLPDDVGVGALSDSEWPAYYGAIAAAVNPSGLTVNIDNPLVVISKAKSQARLARVRVAAVGVAAAAAVVWFLVLPYREATQDLEGARAEADRLAGEAERLDIIDVFVSELQSAQAVLASLHVDEPRWVAPVRALAATAPPGAVFESLSLATSACPAAGASGFTGGSVGDDFACVDVDMATSIPGQDFTDVGEWVRRLEAIEGMTVWPSPLSASESESPDASMQVSFTMRLPNQPPYRVPRTVGVADTGDDATAAGAG